MGKAFTLVTSEPLLDELHEKLRQKFSISEASAQKIKDDLRHSARIVYPDFALNAVPGDEDHNRVLECAVAGGADFIVSGDKHLLRLGSHAGIPILTVRQFLETAGFRVD